MTNFVLTITPTPEAIRIRAWTLPDDEPLTMEDVTDHLNGGFFEIVRSRELRGIVAVVDDTGMLKGLQPNHPATQMVGYPSTLVGPALICAEHMGPEGPDLFPLTESEADDVLSRLSSAGPTDELLETATPYREDR